MKTLDTSFTHNGFRHEQVVRRGRLAVFRRTKGNQEHFETVRIQSHKGFKIAGKEFPPAETYPSSEMWGLNGWTFSDALKAREKMDDLELQALSATQ